VSFLLDTDTCSYHLRRGGALTTRLTQYSGRLATPTITVAELHVWAHRLSDPRKRLELISGLLADFKVLDFDRAAAEQFGSLRAAQLNQGIVKPVVDLMIASVALVHDLTLVTHNTKDFQNIPGLRLEDWIAG